MDGRQLIASRVAMMFKNGDLVNLGFGLPVTVADYLPNGVELWLQAENGMIGQGPTPEAGNDDVDLFNAGALPSTILPGGCTFDTATSFSLIRGGHVSATVLGAFEADQEGSVANWMIPGVLIPGMGGAMDLCAGCKRVIIAMEHCTKEGASKILKKCTLPLTASKRATHIVTDLCFIEVLPEGLLLKEIAPGYTIDEVVERTEADLIIPDIVEIMLEK